MVVIRASRAEAGVRKPCPPLNPTCDANWKTSSSRPVTWPRPRPAPRFRSGAVDVAEPFAHFGPPRTTGQPTARHGAAGRRRPATPTRPNPSTNSPRSLPTSTGTGCSSPGSWPRITCSCTRTAWPSAWKSAKNWPRRRPAGPERLRPGGPLRQHDAAADLPHRRRAAGDRIRPGATAGPGEAAGQPAQRDLPRRRQPRLGLPVLADEEEGRGQQERRARSTGGRFPP